MGSSPQAAHKTQREEFGTPCPAGKLEKTTFVPLVARRFLCSLNPGKWDRRPRGGRRRAAGISLPSLLRLEPAQPAANAAPAGRAAAGWRRQDGHWPTNPPANQPGHWPTRPPANLATGHPTHWPTILATGQTSHRPTQPPATLATPATGHPGHQPTRPLATGQPSHPGHQPPANPATDPPGHHLWARPGLAAPMGGPALDPRGVPAGRTVAGEGGHPGGFGSSSSCQRVAARCKGSLVPRRKRRLFVGLSGAELCPPEQQQQQEQRRGALREGLSLLPSRRGSGEGRSEGVFRAVEIVTGWLEGRFSSPEEQTRHWSAGWGGGFGARHLFAMAVAFSKRLGRLG